MKRRRPRGFGSATKDHVAGAVTAAKRAHEAAERAGDAVTHGRCGLAWRELQDSLLELGRAEAHLGGAGAEGTERLAQDVHTAQGEAHSAGSRFLMRCLK